MDEDAAFDELEALENKLNIESEEIRRIVCNAESRGKTFKLGEIEIRIKPGMPDKARDLIVEIQNLVGGVDEETAIEVSDKVQGKMYQMLANLCVDPPYSEPDLWRIVDKQTGAVDGILKEILENTLGFAEALRKFRKKR
jgi:hypothetical protein